MFKSKEVILLEAVRIQEVYAGASVKRSWKPTVIFLEFERAS